MTRKNLEEKQKKSYKILDKEIKKRQPLPPDILISANSDPVPRKIGRIRIAKTLKKHNNK